MTIEGLIAEAGETRPIHREPRLLWSPRSLPLYGRVMWSTGSLRLTVQIIGDAPGFTVEPASGINATLYRFELVRGALVRERPGDVRPHPDRKRYLIDVLLNEDEIGRYLHSARGFVVPRQGAVAGERRAFDVSADLMLAIGQTLSVGPLLRSPPRLATMDGQHVD